MLLITSGVVVAGNYPKNSFIPGGRTGRGSFRGIRDSSQPSGLSGCDALGW